MLHIWSSWREGLQYTVCLKNLKSVICIGRAEFMVMWTLQNQGFHTCASPSSSELLSRKWVCVYTGPPAPTYHQSIMSISYIEPSTLLHNLVGTWRCGMALDLASACHWKLDNCVTPSRWSLQTHFQIKHKWSFSLGPQCIYIFVTARLSVDQQPNDQTINQSTNWGKLHWNDH